MHTATTHIYLQRDRRAADRGNLLLPMNLYITQIYILCAVRAVTGEDVRLTLGTVCI